jgi:hypothetical protein
LDANLKKQVTSISKGIVIYDVVVMVILFIISQLNKPMVMGLIFGSLIAILAFRLMAINIESSLTKAVEGGKSKAKLGMMFGFTSRVVIYAVVLIVSVKNPAINVLGTAIGLISTQLVILIKKSVIDKFAERRNRI